MTIWFTSDLHLGHQNIITMCRRPFSDVSNMNKLLIQNYNEVVAPEDKVIFVGDVCLGQIADTLPLITQLNGTKYLVPGNHDRCSINYSHRGDVTAKVHHWVREYTNVGFNVLPEMSHAIEGFVLCHFPYSGDSHDDDRFADARPVDKGNWLLHGHTHCKPADRVQGRQINVGVDAWNYYPVTLDTLKEIRDNA